MNYDNPELTALLYNPEIAADWCLDNDLQIAAAWLREEGILPPSLGNGHRNGGGNGYGGGSGYGGGCGYGNGGGCGNGDGDGYGNGDGYRYGGGNGNGDGCGCGNGDGCGCGNGDGDGYRNGNGDGCGGGNTPNPQPTKQRTEFMPFKGQYVIVRSRDQGVMCGEYQTHTGREVTLKVARQIWSWSGDRLTLLDVATKVGPVKISAVVPDEVIMLEACGIISTAPEVEEMLRNADPG